MPTVGESIGKNTAPKETSPVVVITGSTCGLGFALAKEFLERGCRVTISGRTGESVEQAGRRENAAGGQHHRGPTEDGGPLPGWEDPGQPAESSPLCLAHRYQSDGSLLDRPVPAPGPVRRQACLRAARRVSESTPGGFSFLSQISPLDDLGDVLRCEGNFAGGAAHIHGYLSDRFGCAPCLF